MKKPRLTCRSFILFVLLNCVIIDAYSISISTRRLYLDPQSDSTFIRVHNMEDGLQICNVDIKETFINKLGNISLVTSGEVTANSAKPLVRLAPKRFTIGTSKHQMVKLLYRRKPGLENGEYRGVLAIQCKEKTENSTRQVTIAPSLIHNVPVIVRTGKLPIQAEFVNTSIIGKTLHLELKIQGQRSLTGKISVINSATDEVIFERINLSIYAEEPLLKLEFALGEYQNTALLAKFTEDPTMGGDLMIQQPVN
jgi:hypothetical protein